MLFEHFTPYLQALFAASGQQRRKVQHEGALLRPLMLPIFSLWPAGAQAAISADHQSLKTSLSSTLPEVPVCLEAAVRVCVGYAVLDDEGDGLALLVAIDAADTLGVEPAELDAELLGVLVALEEGVPRLLWAPRATRFLAVSVAAHCHDVPIDRKGGGLQDSHNRARGPARKL